MACCYTATTNTIAVWILITDAMLILFCYRAVIKNLLLFMNRPVNLKRKIYKAQKFCTTLYAKSCNLSVLRMAQCMTGTCNAPAKRYPTCWILLFLFNVITLFCWAKFFQLNSKSVNSMRIFPVTSSAPNLSSEFAVFQRFGLAYIFRQFT